MADFLTYLGQVSILIAVAFVVYKLLLSRDALHRRNRIILISIVVISFALPLCKINVHPANNNFYLIEKYVTRTNIQPQELTSESEVVYTDNSTDTPIDAAGVLVVIYLSGIIFFLVVRVLSVLRVRRIIDSAEEKHTYNGFNIYISSDCVQSFCFIRKIIMSRMDYDTNFEIISKHEIEHIRQFHYFDLIFLNLAASILWFNPFLWLIHKELVLEHEFWVDRHVVSNGISIKKYQHLLISKVAMAKGWSMDMNHFNQSDLYKRIKTMKKRSSNLTSMKLLVLLPFVGFTLLVFSQKTSKPTESAVESETIIPYQGKIVATYSDRHPGIDVVVTNDTIRAPFAGRVTSAKDASSRGNTLVLKHEDGVETSYSHLAAFLVKENTQVSVGDPIGLVGNTGRSTGKHLHMECRVDNKTVDPVAQLHLK